MFILPVSRFSSPSCVLERSTKSENASCGTVQGNYRLFNYVKAILSIDKVQMAFIHGFQCQTILEGDFGFTDLGLPLVHLTDLFQVKIRMSAYNTL